MCCSTVAIRAACLSFGIDESVKFSTRSSRFSVTIARAFSAGASEISLFEVLLEHLGRLVKSIANCWYFAQPIQETIIVNKAFVAYGSHVDPGFIEFSGVSRE